MKMAALAAQQQSLANNTQTAQQGAADAAQQYQQAAAAPLPGPDFGQFLSTLGGNVASILSGNPSYQQNARQDVQQSKAQTFKARAENLQGLQQVAQQKAEQAQRAGDLEAEQKSRKEYETLAKQLEVVQANHKIQLGNQAKADELKQQHANRLSEIAAQGAESRKTKATPSPTVPGTQSAPWLQRLTRKTTDGVPWIPIGSLTGKTKNEAIIKASELGIPTVDKTEEAPLKEIQIARLNQQKMQRQIEKFLPPDWQSRPQSVPNIAFSKFLKDNNLLSAFGAWRETAVQQLKATAGITGNRQAQKQFELVLKNDIPQTGVFNADPLPVALQRMANVSAMLQSRQDVILNPSLDTLPEYNGDTPPGYVPVGKQTAQQPKQGNTIKMMDPKGKSYVIDQADLKDAIAHGWKRAPNGR
jgi:hypothetical protein